MCDQKSAGQAPFRPGRDMPRLEVLNDAKSIRVHVEKVVLRTRYQALGCISPGEWTPEEFDSYHYLSLMCLRRGVALRLLVSRDSLDDAFVLSYLGRARKEGAHVRVTGSPSGALLLSDGWSAIVSNRGRGRTEQAVFVEERGVVAALSTLFHQAWEGASDLGAFVDRQVGLQEEDRQLLALIAGPGKDVGRARELGVSLRTFHRRVADLYERLGVANRAEATLAARDYRVLAAEGDTSASQAVLRDLDDFHAHVAHPGTDTSTRLD